MTNLKEQLRKSLEGKAAQLGVAENLDVKVAIEYALAGKGTLESAISAMEMAAAILAAEEAAVTSELEKAQVAAIRYNNYLDNGKGKKKGGNKLSIKSKKELFGDTRCRQSLVKLTVEEDGFSPEVIEVQSSAYLRNMATESAVVTIEGFSKQYESFNKDLAIVNLAALEGSEGGYIGLFADEIYVSEDLKSIVVKSPETGVLIDWKTKHEVVTTSGLRCFKSAAMSPAEEKKREAAYLAFNGNKNDFEATLDKISNGMFSVLKESGKGLSYEKFVKLSANFAQGLAPSAEMKEMPMEKVGILFSKTRREFADGGGFFVGPVGLGAQIRFLGSDKWLGLGISRSTMDGLASHYGPAIYVSKITNEVQADFVSAFKGEGPYAEKLVVFGADNGTPDCLIDLNILKTPVSLKKALPANLRILDLAGPSRSTEVTLGSQMCFSLLLSEEGRQLMNDLLQETVDKLFTEYDLKSPRVMGFEEFEKSMAHTGSVINTINPAFARMDRSLKRSNEKALANSIRRALSEYQAQVDGKFCRVLADFGAEFGVEILAENEIFSLDLPVSEVVGIRSPKGGIKEQGIYRNLSTEELLERINTEMENGAKVVAALYRSLRKGSGIAVVPSTILVKLLHSGMDFDFDGMTFITERRVVETMKAQKSVIVEVTDEGNTSVGEEAFDFGADYMTTLVNRQFNNGNLPVGVVCNHNHTWVMLLGDLKLARKVLADLFGRHGKSADYTGLLYSELDLDRQLVKVNGGLTVETLSEIQGVDFDAADDAVIVRIIEDINVLMNRYIQKTIDASKSGEVIEIPDCLLVNDVVHTLSLGSVDFMLYGQPDFDEESSYHEIVAEKLYVKISKAKTTYHKVQMGNTSKFVFADVYHETRKEVARSAAAKFRKMVREEVKLDDELMLRREQASKSEKSFFTKMKKVYGDVTSDRAMRVNGKRPEEKAAINREFRDTVSYIANTIRSATSGMDAEERVLVAMDAATDKRETLYAAPTTFPSVVLAEEYVVLAASHSAGISFIGEPIKGDFKDGEFITVAGGYHLEGFSCEAELEDGVYVVREFNGRLYATQPIKEVMAERLVTNSKLITRLNGGEDFAAAQESILASGGKIETSVWKKFGDSDTLNGFAMDMPKGKTRYAKLLDRLESKADKFVVSRTKTKGSDYVDNMFVCMTAVARKAPVTMKEKLAKKKPVAMVKGNQDASVSF